MVLTYTVYRLHSRSETPVHRQTYVYLPSRRSLLSAYYRPLARCIRLKIGGCVQNWLK